MKSAAALALADAIERAASAAVPVSQGPAQIPTNLSAIEIDLWLFDEEIRETREQLSKARANPALTGRTAALQQQLYSLMDRRRALRPAEAPTQDDEERRWRADAEAVLTKIEAGVTAAEKEIEQ